jgi:uncharacterized protein
MEKKEINQLMHDMQVQGILGPIELVETHISWVMLGHDFVYKIKKPLKYSFLDFSSVEKRKFLSEREITLNKRLTEGIYLDVLPVKKAGDRYFIDNAIGETIDYTVRMVKVDSTRRMDQLISKNLVTHANLQKLADKIATFHKRTEVIYQKDLQDIQIKFSDLLGERDYLEEMHLYPLCQMIDRAVSASEKFSRHSRDLLRKRLETGYTRDCHGDLHSRNIFLLSEPQPFDCIEFNDEYRQIDILNEVAFLCMDMDAMGRYDLSEYFIGCYNHLWNAIKTDEDKQLFYYYKSYRANIRAKVNSLRARSCEEQTGINKFLTESMRYVHLMNHYLNMLSIRV